jgi:hypothetical protein
MDLIDTKSQDRLQDKDRRKHDRDMSDIRAIIKMPEGRRFYWKIMEAGGVFQNAFVACDVNATNFNLGRQSLSQLFLNELMEAKPDALQQMQNERASEAKSEEVIEKKEQEKESELL